jgi:hypothetical protein
MTFAGFYDDFIQKFGAAAVLYCLLEHCFCRAGLETFINTGAEFGIDDIPALAFESCVFEFFGRFAVRMNLNTQHIVGINEFYKQAERRLIVFLPDYLLRMFLQNIGNALAGKLAIGYDGFIAGQIDQFPAFADFFIGGKILI